jgi:hypothetical protein
MHHIPNPKRQQSIKQWLGYVELAERRDDLVKTDCRVRPANAAQVVGNYSRFEQAGDDYAVDDALYG